MLIELGEPHELVQVNIEAGEHRKPEYLKLNPSGVVPTLVIEGKPLGEAAALCMILAERHPQAGFSIAPGHEQRAVYVSWMFFLSNTLQTAYHNWFYPDQPAGQAAVESVKASARRRIEACLERIDRKLAETNAYLMGDRVSAADFVTTMLMRWSRNMPKPATEWPAIAGYVKRMKARPSFKTLYEREGLTEWA
jgi:glutathione S-transferase